MNTLPPTQQGAAALPRQRTGRAAAIAIVVGVVSLGGAAVGIANAARNSDNRDDTAAEVLTMITQAPPSAPALPDAGENPPTITLPPADADAPTITNVEPPDTAADAPDNTFATLPDTTVATEPLDPTTTVADDQSVAEDEEEEAPLPPGQLVTMAHGVTFEAADSLDLTLSSDGKVATLSGDNGLFRVRIVEGQTSIEPAATDLRATISEEVIDFDSGENGDLGPGVGVVDSGLFLYVGVAGSGNMGTAELCGVVILVLREDGVLISLEYRYLIDSDGNSQVTKPEAYRLASETLNVGI